MIAFWLLLRLRQFDFQPPREILHELPGDAA
jgi:hypothetical protein